MAVKAENLWREALALTDSERAGLAAELLASAEEHTEDDPEVVRVAWAEEIERRAWMVIAGESSTEPWETARQRIVDELGG
jgi:phenylpyruvate tautomerase PptA (4-oxalocrotonate tautomerase family)